MAKIDRVVNVTIKRKINHPTTFKVNWLCRDFINFTEYRTYGDWCKYLSYLENRNGEIK